MMHERVLALAGLVQALKQVRRIADTGQADASTLSTALDSVFRIDADSPEEVYGTTGDLRPGLTLLRDYFGNRNKDEALPRLALAVMQIERRFVRDAGDQLDDLIELTRCDCTTRNQRKAKMLSDRMDELEARIAELAESEELAKVRPDLDGDQIMAHLGIGPGRVVGEAVSMLLELRLDEGPLGEAEAYERLDEWWNRRKDQQ